ncbi:tetratricopeptide repeat protein [Sulfitobacter sp. JB4-11]|uniref:tetratricopeptide repeat protein n=1 Tax=Sulfitobacter rhodophyticola TaxID=3238304 RepID=UPI0035152C43
MRTTIFSAVLAVLALPSLADCPAPQDTRREMLNLIAKSQAAPNHMEGRRVSGEMWELWLKAPDEAAQEALDAGMRRRDVADFVGALAEFDRLTEYCPTYAEGFNQRAYLYFLSGRHEKALVDLDIALTLQPLHIAAQAGRALTLMNLGRIDEAREQMLIAVENNPWLSEKALLAEGAPLGPKGKDI